MIHARQTLLLPIVRSIHCLCSVFLENLELSTYKTYINYRKTDYQYLIMKKLIFTFSLAASSLFATVHAQTNGLAKTTWELETSNADGSAIFKKAKSIKFPEEQPKFKFLQFGADKKYHTGNLCFQMMGTYSVYEDNQVEINEGSADMSSGCDEPKPLIGTYSFKIDKDHLTLTPVKN